MGNSKRRSFIANAFEHNLNECVIWPFSVRKSSGYGAFDDIVDGKRVNKDVHRYVCERANGTPEKGMQASHKCGQKLCVNPRHLYWATPKQNMADAISHGTLKGGGRYRQQLFHRQRLEIANSTDSLLALSKKFGMDPAYIGKVRREMRHMG